MPYFYVAPDISIIDKKNGAFLFKSDTLAIELDGASAAFLVSNIIPLLTGSNDFDFVCSQIKNVTRDDLHQHLGQLVNAGVLKISDVPKIAKGNNHRNQQFSNFLEIIGLDPEVARRKLATFKIAIIGLDTHGVQTLFALQQSGISNFKLIDPYPCDAEFLISFPFLKPYCKDGTTKQECLHSYYRENEYSINIDTGPATPNKETLEQSIIDCSLCIVCFDKALSSIYYWTNQASVSNKIPVLYTAIASHLCLIGPLVIPGKTACYMCYKMRVIATQEDIEGTVLYEEQLSDNKVPSSHNRVSLPGASSLVASTVASEALKFLLSLGYPSTQGRVFEFNMLNFESKLHTLLQKPDCIICQKNHDRQLYSVKDLIENKISANLGEIYEQLISPHCGIIQQLELIPHDIYEPLYPLVYAAKLANFIYMPKKAFEKLSCSGKGMDTMSAKISAVGEAVERYSGSIYFPEEIHYASYAQIKGSALNPEDLVLYAPEQYKNIAFAPFHEDAEMGWINGYSLLTDRIVKVPAYAALLHYAMKDKNEYICQNSSNGLAAGSNMLHAILSATMEVIERDALMIAWHNELPCKKIDPLNHPLPEVVELCRAYESAGVELQLYQLPTDTPCFVFLGVAVQKTGNGPSVVIGMGADFSPVKAAKSALLEIGQVRPAFKQRLLMPETIERLKILLEDPQKVENLEDHNLFYGAPDFIAAFDFLFKQPVVEFDWRQEYVKEQSQQLEALLDYCKKENTDIIYCNLTPPDMKQLGLYTAKVIIPGFQPLHFGWKNIRLGGKRLFELPKKLGLRDDVTTIPQINMNPHPLS